MTKNRKLFTVAALLLVFAAVKLAALYWWQQQQPQVRQALCDVRRGCMLPNGVHAKFSDTVNAKQPFDIVLTRVPSHVAEAEVSFSMKDMDMGFNRYKLTREADGTWAARQIRLPVCVQARHDYLADIRIGGETFQTAFTAE
ncbi:hypothetical protein [Neisseria sp.]|uniref:hypothetical protein n=1 Tax=Neisseria sp. TaxID=192066 RepID=UPI00359F1E5F